MYYDKNKFLFPQILEIFDKSGEKWVKKSYKDFNMLEFDENHNVKESNWPYDRNHLEIKIFKD